MGKVHNGERSVIGKTQVAIIVANICGAGGPILLLSVIRMGSKVMFLHVLFFEHPLCSCWKMSRRATYLLLEHLSLGEKKKTCIEFYVEHVKLPNKQRIREFEAVMQQFFYCIGVWLIALLNLFTFGFFMLSRRWRPPICGSKKFEPPPRPGGSR